MSDMLKKFSSQAHPEVLAALKTIAREEGRQFQAVLEQAMLEYIERKKGDEPRDAVLKHFRNSLKQNYQLGRLLSE